MPATPTHCKRYAISYMWDIHHEIIRLAATGMRPNEIAETLNCSTVMVTYTLNSPIAAAKLAVLRQDRDTAVVSIVDRLKNSASEAAKYLESVAEGRIPEAHPALRVKACTEILDRAGYSKVQRNVSLNLDGKLTDDEISNIVTRATQNSSIVVQAQEPS